MSSKTRTAGARRARSAPVGARTRRASRSAFLVGVLVMLVATALAVAATVRVVPARAAGAGSLQWVLHLGGFGRDDDAFLDVVTNAAGQVYGVGHLYGSASYKSQAAVAKYGPGGHKLWVRLYGGSGWDTFSDAALDAQGNVYATGTSLGTGTSTFITVKYSGDGKRLWAKSYAYLENGGNGAVALTVDREGDCYVTGAIATSADASGWATVKYDADGNEKWVAVYAPASPGGAPAAIALDAAGNAYVTGDAPGADVAQEAVTIKYSGGGVTAGRQQWLTEYAVTGSAQTTARAIAVRSGSVYVAGFGLLDKTPWQDGFVAKYAVADGVEKWAKGWKSPKGADVFSDMVVDGAGNAYVTGSYKASATDRNGMAVKFSPTGKVVWAGTADLGRSDAMKALTRDAHGNVVVTGRSGTGLPTAKFSPAGKLIWARSYRSKNDDNDAARAVATHGERAVYVAGYGTIKGHNMAALLVKYTP